MPPGVPSVTVRLVRKTWTVSWPWTWMRKRRLKRVLEQQLQKRADELRKEAWAMLRDAGYL